MLTIEHSFVPLVEHFLGLSDPAQSGALRIAGFGRNRNPGAQCVADMNRARKPQTVVAVGKGARIDLPRGQTNADRKGERAVGDPLAEGLRFAPFRINVMGEKIAAVTG